MSTVVTGATAGIDLADPVWVAGHTGLVGSAIVRRLEALGFRNVLTRERAELDLTDRVAVDRFVRDTRPAYAYIAAARVGGIAANAEYPVEFLRDNLAIELNVLDACWRAGVRKAVLLGSSCIYPRLAPQPIAESSLLTGSLEPTNEPYAVAKIAGIKLCQAYRAQYGADFVSVMPTNLFGPNDNFDPHTSHVLPALIRKFSEAARTGMREVNVWGSGTPRREFLYVDDLAAALTAVMDSYSSSQPINIGAGRDISIADLASVVADVVDFDGEITFDTSRPDGTPGKLLDSSRIAALGWQPQTSLRDGIRLTYEWYALHGGPQPLSLPGGRLATGIRARSGPDSLRCDVRGREFRGGV